MKSQNPPGENSTEVFSIYFYRVLCFFISKKKKKMSRDSVGKFFTVYSFYTYIFPCFYSSTMPFSTRT